MANPTARTSALRASVSRPGRPSATASGSDGPGSSASTTVTGTRLLFSYGVRRSSRVSVPTRATGSPYSADAVSRAVEKQPTTSAGRIRRYSTSARTGVSSTVSSTPSRSASCSRVRAKRAGAEGCGLNTTRE